MIALVIRHNKLYQHKETVANLQSLSTCAWIWSSYAKILYYDPFI